MPKKATRDGGREQMQRRAEHVAVGRGHLAPGTGYLTVTYVPARLPYHEQSPWPQKKKRRRGTKLERRRSGGIAGGEEEEWSLATWLIAT